MACSLGDGSKSHLAPLCQTLCVCHVAHHKQLPQRAARAVLIPQLYKTKRVLVSRPTRPETHFWNSTPDDSGLCFKCTY